MKLAILIAIHNHPEQANVFIGQCLSNPNVDIFIHIDEKAIGIEKQLLQNERIHILPVHYNVSWGDFTQIQFVISLLDYAFQFGKYDYYSLHTGNDLLIRPISELMTFLEEDNKYAYLVCRPLPWAQWQYGGGLGRLALRWPKSFRKRLKPVSFMRYARAIYGRLYGAGILKGKKLPELQFYGSSAFYTLRHDCAVNCLQYILAHQEFVDLFRTALCGDEIFFDTLANLTADGQPVENDNNLRYINFEIQDKRNVGAPKTLTMDDKDRMIRSNAFFARKVDLSVDKDVIDFFVEYTA